MGSSYLDSLGYAPVPADIYLPKQTKLLRTAGLKALDERNEVFYDQARINYNTKILASEVNSVTGLRTHTLSSNSAYAFAIGQVLLSRNIVSQLPFSLSSTLTGFYKVFRNKIVTGVDVVADKRLGLGEVGIIAIKKVRYGDFVRATTLTAITNNGLLFKDACSASKNHGIMVYTTTADLAWSNAVSAGFIFYDLGLISLHGNSITAVDSVSSLSSVEYYSSIDINTLSVLCTAGPNELNYSTNDSAFYNADVTANPNFSTTFSTLDLTTSGFQWGTVSSTGLHSMYYLYGFKDRPLYVTTVGLYNPSGDLLAVAKTTQPIRKSRKIPLTIKAQIDL